MPPAAFKPLKQVVDDLNATRWITAEKVLVVYRAGDATGQAVAEYYQQRRGIPAANVVAVTMTWQPSDGLNMSTADCNNLLAQLRPHLVDPIRVILTCHWFPKTVNSAVQTYGNITLLSNVLSSHRWFLTQAAATRYNSVRREGKFAAYFSSSYPLGYLQPNFGCSKSLNRLRDFTLPPATGYLNSIITGYCVPHFRLEVLPVENDDTRIANPSELNYLKRIIDDSIAAEAATYADFGTVAISGNNLDNAGNSCDLELNAQSSALACVSPAYPVYAEMGGVKYKHLYCDGLTADLMKISRSTPINASVAEPTIHRTATGNHLVVQPVAASCTTAAVEPTWDTSGYGALTTDGTCTFKYLGTLPANNLPATATALVPGKPTKTFVPLTDVFLRITGVDSYYTKCPEIEQVSDFAYRTGALALFSQSLPVDPVPLAGIDYEFGTYIPKNRVQTACYNAKVALEYVNKNGITVQSWAFISTVAGSTVTVSSGLITLKEGAATVAQIDLTAGGTLRANTATVKANLTAGWTFVAKEADPESVCPSRSDVAVRNGTVAYFGACSEPLSTGTLSTTGLVKHLWYGMNLSEVAYMLLDQIDGQIYTYCMGDPLYRPFGHRR
jgi:hypothetical protein